MRGIPRAGSLSGDIAARGPLVNRGGEVGFGWSPAKLRIAAFVLLGAALPAALGFAGSPPVLRWLCLAWLAGIGVLMHGLARRAACDDAVLTIDERGLLDRRLMPRHIAWQEIKSVCPVDPARSRVADIVLRDPGTTLAGTRWCVRVGATCQIGYGVPAVTISMLLLEADVTALLDAIARHRPDLLHPTNRKAVGATRS